MSDEPLISIVTPSFNMGRFLERALESVHGQSDRIEHIVVDGGSTDESPTIIESWARRLAWRVSQPDRGQSDAINKGFQIARGRFGAWLNADDWYQPGALNAVVADLERDPDVDLLIGRCRFIDMEGRVVFDPKPPDPVSVESLLRLRSQWFDGRLLVQPEVFFRLALFRRVGGLDVHNHYSMDHDLWIRLLDAGARVRLLDLQVANLGVHEGQKTSSNMRAVASILEHSSRYARTHPVSAHVRNEIDAMEAKHRVVATLLDAWGDPAPEDPPSGEALAAWSGIDEPSDHAPPLEDLIGPLQRAFRWKRHLRAALVTTAPSAIGDTLLDVLSRRRLDMSIVTPNVGATERWIGELGARTGRFTLHVGRFGLVEPGETYDLVFLHDVLHRVEDPRRMLDDWRSRADAVVSLSEPASAPPIEAMRPVLESQVSSNDDVLWSPRASAGLRALARRIEAAGIGVFRASHHSSAAIELPDATLRILHGGFDAHPLVRAALENSGEGVLQSCVWTS